MDKRSNEPGRLRRGKAFHRQIQSDWFRNARDGLVHIERTCTKPSGRAGRMDVFLESSDDNRLVVIAEVKATDWDRMTDRAVRRNARRYIRQIWSYLEPQLASGCDVCPGVIFPHLPSDPRCRDLVERLFEEEGIPVVWSDETTAERRLRSEKATSSDARNLGSVQ